MNLPAYLKSLGYIEVPFTVTRVNHIVVHAKVNGEDVVLIVDTGASRTCIAESCAERLGLTSGRAEKVAVSFHLVSAGALGPARQTYMWAGFMIANYTIMSIRAGWEEDFASVTKCQFELFRAQVPMNPQNTRCKRMMKSGSSSASTTCGSGTNLKLGMLTIEAEKAGYRRRSLSLRVANPGNSS